MKREYLTLDYEKVCAEAQRCAESDFQGPKGEGRSEKRIAALLRAAFTVLGLNPASCHGGPAALYTQKRWLYHDHSARQYRIVSIQQVFTLYG